MKRTPKFMFDECVPPSAVEALVAVLVDKPVFDFTAYRFGGGSNDEHWIPEISKEKCWIVITGDGGEKPKRHERKLPDLCQECRVTHIVFTGKVHDCGWFEKAQILARLWDEIVATRSVRRGARFILRYHPHKPPSVNSVILERKPAGTGQKWSAKKVKNKRRRNRRKGLREDDGIA